MGRLQSIRSPGAAANLEDEEIAGGDIEAEGEAG